MEVKERRWEKGLLGVWEEGGVRLYYIYVGDTSTKRRKQHPVVCLSGLGNPAQGTPSFLLLQFIPQTILSLHNLVHTRYLLVTSSLNNRLLYTQRSCSDPSTHTGQQPCTKENLRALSRRSNGARNALSCLQLSKSSHTHFACALPNGCLRWPPAP